LASKMRALSRVRVVTRESGRDRDGADGHLGFVPCVSGVLQPSVSSLPCPLFLRSLYSPTSSVLVLNVPDTFNAPDAWLSVALSPLSYKSITSTCIKTSEFYLSSRTTMSMTCHTLTDSSHRFLTDLTIRTLTGFVSPVPIDTSPKHNTSPTNGHVTSHAEQQW
jgi:hypothetical protein